MSYIHCTYVESINSDQMEHEFISKQIRKLHVRLLHSKLKVEAYFRKMNTHNSQASTQYSLLNCIYFLMYFGFCNIVALWSLPLQIFSPNCWSRCANVNILSCSDLANIER